MPGSSSFASGSGATKSGITNWSSESRVSRTSPRSEAVRRKRRSRVTGNALIGRPLSDGRVEGVWGNRKVPPHEQEEGGNVGGTWFPPRERGEGERRSRPDGTPLLAQDARAGGVSGTGSSPLAASRPTSTSGPGPPGLHFWNVTRSEK